MTRAAGPHNTGRRGLLALAALLLILTGCGDGDVESVDDAPATSDPDATAEPSANDLLPTSTTIDPDDVGPTTSDTMFEPCSDALPAPTPTTDQPVGFRPVLEIVFPDDCEAAADLPRDASGMRFHLGPALPDGMVESATAVSDPVIGAWLLALTLNAGRPGIDDLNDIAARCIEFAPECPTGQLAIVQGDLVISAPTIQQPSYDRDSIQISGSLTEEDARILAEALNP